MLFAEYEASNCNAWTVHKSLKNWILYKIENKDINVCIMTQNSNEFVLESLYHIIKDICPSIKTNVLLRTYDDNIHIYAK